MFYLLLFLCGCLTGVSAVLFGFGGGFVVVPLLITCCNSVAPPTTRCPGGHAGRGGHPSTCVMINAALATYRHRRAGSLLRAYVWPLARTSVSARCSARRWSAWPAATHPPGLRRLPRHHHLVCLLRRASSSQPRSQARPLGVGETRLGGTLIGAIATFLGVGGSVMIVPLLRRCGLSMTQATSIANPAEPAGGSLRGPIHYLVLAGYQE